MERFRGNVECSCETLPGRLVHVLTKTGFVCLVTQYKRFHFRSSLDIGHQQTLALLTTLGVSSSHTLLPSLLSLIKVHYKEVFWLSYPFIIYKTQSSNMDLQ